MEPRYIRSNEREESYTSHADVYIERLRRIRALNGDPAVFGMESYAIKRLSLDKITLLTRASILPH